MSIYIQEQWVNRTEGHLNGETDIYESFCDTPGEVFKYARRQWGRCVGKMYRETKEGDKHIGWVFQKLQQYDDVNEKYLLETWVSLHESPPTKTIEYHPMELASL